MARYWCIFFFQAEDGIRDLVRSRGLGDVYKRQDYFEANLRAEMADKFDPEAINRALARDGYDALLILSLIHI